jgi:hypothetical protein
VAGPRLEGRHEIIVGHLEVGRHRNMDSAPCLSAQ